MAAQAQEVATSFEELRFLVEPGETVTVTDANGRESSGKIAELSTSSLGLLMNKTRRDLQESEVMVIRQRRPDSLANGAKWGFAAGAAFGLIFGLTGEYEG